MKDFDQIIAAINNELVQMRKDFHRFPEIGFKEYRTAEKVAEYMKSFGLEVLTDIGGTGLVGLLRGKDEGPTIGIRACLDALAMERRSSGGIEKTYFLTARQ